MLIHVSTRTPGLGGAAQLQAVTRSWPLEMVVAAAFEKSGVRERVRFELALKRVEWYAQAGVAEAAKIEETIAPYESDVAADELTVIPAWPEGSLITGAHFYFICWHSVSESLNTLRQNAAGLTAPREVWRQYRHDLERYSKARDHLEHYVERLPIGRHSTWLHTKSDEFEKLEGDPAAVRLTRKFTLNSESWDVSPKSSQRLGSVWPSLVEAIRSETDTGFAAWLNGGRFTK